MNFAVNMERFASSLSPYIHSFKDAGTFLCEKVSHTRHVSFVALKTMPKEPLLCAALVGALVHISSQAAFNRGYVEGSLKNRSISCLLVGACASTIFAVQVACRVQLVFVILFACAVAGTLEALSGSKPDLLRQQLEAAKNDLRDKDQEIAVLKTEANTGTQAEATQVTGDELRRLQEIGKQYEQMCADKEQLIEANERLKVSSAEAKVKITELEGKLTSLADAYKVVQEKLAIADVAAENANIQRTDVQALLDEEYRTNTALQDQITAQSRRLKEVSSWRDSGVGLTGDGMPPTPVKRKLENYKTQIATLQQTLAAQRRELEEFHTSAVDELLSYTGRLSVEKAGFTDEAIAWDKERESLKKSIVELNESKQILEKELQEQNAKTLILELALKMCAEKFAEAAQSDGKTTPINALEILRDCYLEVGAAFRDETQFVENEQGQVTLHATPSRLATPSKAPRDRRLTCSVKSPFVGPGGNSSLLPDTAEEFHGMGNGLSPMGNGDRDDRRLTDTVVHIPFKLIKSSANGEEA